MLQGVKQGRLVVLNSLIFFYSVFEVCQKVLILFISVICYSDFTSTFISIQLFVSHAAHFIYLVLRLCCMLKCIPLLSVIEIFFLLFLKPLLQLLVLVLVIKQQFIYVRGQIEWFLLRNSQLKITNRNTSTFYSRSLKRYYRKF